MLKPTGPVTHLPDLSSEDGFSTAELLANAALGVAAIAVIWAGMEALGADVVEFIRGQMFGT